MLLSKCKGNLSQQRLSTLPWHLQHKISSPSQLTQVSQKRGCRQLGNWLRARGTEHREPKLHNKAKRSNLQVLWKVVTLAMYQRRKSAVGVYAMSTFQWAAKYVQGDVSGTCTSARAGGPPPDRGARKQAAPGCGT